ncbi:hypothetical protein O3M35_012459 [Rhynocoris fuscipes]|uniref:PH domain-containing protein n=1 Tax=Rhynocoris fuscipes TaxID=488301 RepID=A0AAW1CVK9_9HEMI
MSRTSTMTSTINSSKSDLNCYELMSDCQPTSMSAQFTPVTINTVANGKSGRLGRRERFLFVGQTKKCWGTLVTSPEPTLHLYAHQGDNKAHTVLQLDGYQARPLASSSNASNNKSDSTTNKSNNHQMTTFEIFCPGKKTYQFTAETSCEMNSWVEALNEACLRHKRQLPCIPAQSFGSGGIPQPPPLPPQELYDTPDSRVRPVTPLSNHQHQLNHNNHHHYLNQQEYERMHDSLYHIIDDKKRPKQEQLYKNVGIDDEDDTCYYNLVPRAVEDIYQTITETNKSITSVEVTSALPTTTTATTATTVISNNNNNTRLSTAPQNRIQAIIKAMEASIAESQLYEPVDTTQEPTR